MSDTPARDQIIVLGTFELDPTDRDTFIESRREQVAESRAEAGNLEYAFSADGRDPGRVLLTERWASHEQFQAHLDRINAQRGPDGPVEAVPIRDRSFAVFRAQPIG